MCASSHAYLVTVNCSSQQCLVKPSLQTRLMVNCLLGKSLLTVSTKQAENCCIYASWYFSLINLRVDYYSCMCVFIFVRVICLEKHYSLFTDKSMKLRICVVITLARDTSLEVKDLITRRRPRPLQHLTLPTSTIKTNKWRSHYQHLMTVTGNKRRRCSSICTVRLIFTTIISL